VTAALPDPLEFAVDALLAEGALVERDADGWLVLLPSELARELGVGEECRLVPGAPEAPRADLLACSIGTPLLERLASRFERSYALATARLEVEPPRGTAARALLERFAVRNAPMTVGDVSPSAATYLVAWLAWSAEADDRYDGIVQAGVCLDDAGVADPGLLALADPVGAASRLHAAPLKVDPDTLRRGAALASARAEAGLDAALADVRALVARRLRRDHQRIAEYFEQLARDAQAARRRIDAAVVEDKLAHLLAERDAKLRALGERYRLRVSLTPIALILLEVPTLRVQLRVRRRKLEGALYLRLAPGAGGFDRLACAACSGATSYPVLCDDRLHVLCEVCAPSALGRPTCSACRGSA
jgi:hypothetical protein